MAAVGSAATRPRAPAISGGSREAGWPVGVHPLLLLLHIMPELLVEPGQVPRSIHPAAVLSLACRQSRSGHRRAARPPRGSVPPLSLSYDHELHKDMSERTESGARDRQHQTHDVRARLMSRSG